MDNFGLFFLCPFNLLIWQLFFNFSILDFYFSCLKYNYLLSCLFSLFTYKVEVEELLLSLLCVSYLKSIDYIVSLIISSYFLDSNNYTKRSYNLGGMYSTKNTIFFLFIFLPSLVYLSLNSKKKLEEILHQIYINVVEVIKLLLQKIICHLFQGFLYFSKFLPNFLLDVVFLNVTIIKVLCSIWSIFGLEICLYSTYIIYMQP